jgi:hypothetical protein
VASVVLSNLPLSFVENRGQVRNRDIAQYVTTLSASIGFTAEGLRLGLTDTQGTAQRWGLALDFVGGRARPVAEDLQQGVVSFFNGDASEWMGVDVYRGKDEELVDATLRRLEIQSLADHEFQVA